MCSTVSDSFQVCEHDHFWLHSGKCNVQIAPTCNAAYTVLESYNVSFKRQSGSCFCLPTSRKACTTEFSSWSCFARNVLFCSVLFCFVLFCAVLQCKLIHTSAGLCKGGHLTNSWFSNLASKQKVHVASCPRAWSSSTRHFASSESSCSLTPLSQPTLTPSATSSYSFHPHYCHFNMSFDTRVLTQCYLGFRWELWPDHQPRE